MHLVTGALTISLLLHFAMPPTWTDLSPGVPDQAWEGVSPTFKASVKSDTAIVFFAAELNGPADGFLENMNARIQRSPGPLTDAMLVKLAALMPAGMPNVNYQLIDHRIVVIDGVDCGRIVSSLLLDGSPSVDVTYLLPSGDQLGIVVFSTTPDALKTYEPVFDAAIRRTSGIQGPPSREYKVLGEALIAGLAGGLAALLMALARKRRRARRQP